MKESHRGLQMWQVGKFDLAFANGETISAWLGIRIQERLRQHPYIYRDVCGGKRVYRPQNYRIGRYFPSGRRQTDIARRGKCGSPSGKSPPAPLCGRGSSLGTQRLLSSTAQSRGNTPRRTASMGSLSSRAAVPGREFRFPPCLALWPGGIPRQSVCLASPSPDRNLLGTHSLFSPLPQRGLISVSIW